MNKKIFDLVYSDYEWSKHYYFEGPEESSRQEFELLCQQLLPRAGYRAMLKQSSPNQGGWICWSDVVESLIPLLEKQGYLRFTLDNCHIEGSGIIGIFTEEPPDERLGFSAKLIYDYNRKLSQKMAEEREAKRAKRIGFLKKKIPQIMK
jgi:hypothetical protein